jgi:hypothetical protein
MPKAKTIVQKIAMTGQNPSIEKIEAGNFKYQEMRGGGLGRILKKVFKKSLGVFLYLIGIAIVLSFFVALFFPWAFNLPSARDLLESNALYTLNIITALLILWLAPAFMLIYFGVRLMIKITARDLIILSVTFLIWILSGCYIASVGVKKAQDYKSEAVSVDEFIPAIQSDTIYVRLDDSYEVDDSYKAFSSSIGSQQLLIANAEDRSYLFTPPVMIKKDSLLQSVKVEIKKRAFDKNDRQAKLRAKGAKLDIKEDASSLILSPPLYNKNSLWDRTIYSIIIHAPQDKTIIVEKPLSGKNNFLD